MNVLLVGNGPRYNRGCEGITITTVGLLQKYFPYANIKILSFRPEIDIFYESILNVKVTDIKDADWNDSRIARIYNRLFLPPNYRYNHAILHPYIEALDNTDFILSLGGDSYTDDYNGREIFWSMAQFAKNKKVPYIVWGGSVGPFKSTKTLSVAKRGLRCIEAVAARESLTAETLRSLRYKGKIFRVFDPAFLLEPQQATLPKFDNKNEIVGFNISPLYHKYTGRTLEEVQSIAMEFISKISRDYNVLLVPHVFQDNYNNDANYMKPIADVIPNVKIAPSILNSRQLKYLISKCNYFIGARTHSTIAAFSERTPVLSLAYSQKAHGLNRDLFGSDEYLLDAKEFSLENLEKKFNYLQKSSTKCKKQLISNTKDMLKTFEPVINYLKEICQ